MVQTIEDRSHPPLPNDPFELSVYETVALDGHQGQTPSLAVAMQISDGLVDTEINHRIFYDLDPVDIGTENPTCGGSGLGAWADYLEQQAPAQYVSKDSNVLLTNFGGGGGCAYGPGLPPFEQHEPGGNAAITDTAGIDHYDGREFTGSDAWAGGVYRAMHEVGHNMGFQPGNGAPTDPDCRQYGETWVGSRGFWHKTPCIGRRDATVNDCGVAIVPDPDVNEHDELELWYANCLTDRIGLSPPPVQPPPPGSAEVTGISVEPLSATVGEPVSIKAQAQNTMDTAASFDRAVLVGSTASTATQIGTLHFDIGPRDTALEQMTWTPTATGSYVVLVGTSSDSDQQRASVTVSQPSTGGRIDIYSILTNPVSPIAGSVQPTDITVRAINQGSSFAFDDFNVFINGEPLLVNLLHFSLDPGETGVAHANWTPQDPGSYEIEVGGVSITRTVQPAIRPPIIRRDPMPYLSAGFASLLGIGFFGRPGL